MFKKIKSLWSVITTNVQTECLNEKQLIKFVIAGISFLIIEVVVGITLFGH